MDSHDYNRLQGQAVRERGNQKAQYLRMIYDELRRQNILRLIDYTDYYPVNVQNKNIGQCRDELASVAEHENRRAAKRAADGFIQYGSGSYQESFRAVFNADGERIESFKFEFEHDGCDVTELYDTPEMYCYRAIEQHKKFTLRGFQIQKPHIAAVLIDRE